jgi:hypothetical protein
MVARWSVIRCVVAGGLVSVWAGCGILGPAKEDAPAFALRVNCAAEEPYVDRTGVTWLPDRMMARGAEWGAVGGETVLRDLSTVLGTDSPKVYVTERYGMDSYEFVVPEGSYTVRLHFAETWPPIEAAGERVFSVSINGEPVLRDFDPFKEAGKNRPVVKGFRNRRAVDGKIVIEFAQKVNQPEINGIEIIRK